MTVAAFCAVASTPHTYNGVRVTPEALALPPAVLVHEGHDLAAAAAGPVAVAVPSYLDGRVVVDAVFASSAAAARAAEQVRRGRRSVSVIATGYGTYAEFRYGVLVAVDLVAVAADPGARITSTTTRADLSPELRRCRAAFDRYLADLANPQQIDLGAAVASLGVRAFDPLAPVVAGIRQHHAARARLRSRQLAEVEAIVRGLRRRTMA